MSSVSEQDHLNPRDPLYYAPRSLRERSAMRGPSSEMTFAPTSFDSQLESAVSDALRHPLDPEIMHEPGLESRKALWTIAARFAAAVGVRVLQLRTVDQERAVSIRRGCAKACDQRIPVPSRLHAAKRSGVVRAVGTVAPAVHAVAGEAGSGHATTTHQPIVQIQAAG